MMKIAAVLLIIFFSFSAFGQNVDVEDLKDSFENLSDTNTKKNQLDFFNDFPKSFERFNDTFGYDEGKAAPLYDGWHYVNLFFSLDSIDKTTLLKKCINIGIGGWWDADAINYFQQGLRSEILENPELSYSLMRTKSNSEIKSFFYFFFDETHAQFKTVPEELQALEAIDGEFYDLLLSAFNKVLKERSR